MQWVPIADGVPRGEALIWSGGRALVAVLLGPDESCPNPTFVDARTDDLPEWPSHWMALPAPPAPDAP